MSARLVRALTQGYVCVRNKTSGEAVVFFPNATKGLGSRVIRPHSNVVLSNEIPIPQLKSSTNLKLLIDSGVLSVLDKPKQPELQPKGIKVQYAPIHAPLPSSNPNERPVGAPAPALMKVETKEPVEEPNPEPVIEVEQPVEQSTKRNKNK